MVDNLASSIYAKYRRILKNKNKIKKAFENLYFKYGLTFST